MRHLSLLRLATLILALVPAIALASEPARLSGQPDRLPGALVMLRAGRGTHVSHARRLAPLSAGVQSANIQVSYHGFSAEAQTAFQYAIDIWETKISSPVTIRVDAYWEPLGTGVLGAAGPNDFLSNFTNAPRANTWYPAALANKLTGTDLEPSNPDIVAQFNSTFSGWYFGTDGQAPLGKYDFATTVLHELGHGLGFIGSLEVVGAQGQWGVFGGQFTNSPIVLDRFAVNGAQQSLIDTGHFPNPSTALKDQLVGGSVFFAGTNADAASGGSHPRLYAPSPWEDGSSFSHLDESAYPAGDPDALMTPILNDGESIDDPGPIALGIFRDIGWEVSTDPPIAGLTATNDGPTTLGTPTAFAASVTSGAGVSFTWNFGDGATATGANVAHTYAHAGSYIAMVTATNASDSRTAWTMVQVPDVAISGLTASNNGPTNRGNPTTLTAAVAAGTGVGYTWNFGDGTSAAGVTASHTYAGSGSYIATVTATNSAGSVTASTVVQVLDATASTTVAPAGGTLTTPDGSVRLSVPPGAVSDTVIITYTALFAPAQPLPEGRLAVRSFRLEASTSAGVPITAFDAPVTLDVTYTDADLATSGVPESTLDALFWDGGAWSATPTCAGCGVDTAANQVSLSFTRTGEFAIVGQGPNRLYLPLAQD